MKNSHHKNLLLYVGKKLEKSNQKLVLTIDQWIRLSTEIKSICKSDELAEKVFAWFFSFSGLKYYVDTAQDEVFRCGDLLTLKSESDIVTILDILKTAVRTGNGGHHA